METVFLKIVNMSITASWIVLAVILLRMLLKKAPKWLSGILWVFVALRLIFPFSIESVLSLIPSAKTLPDNFVYTAEPTITSGIPAINYSVNPILSESLAPNPGASANPTQILSFIAAAIWLIGLGAMLIYMAISYIVLRVKVRERVHVESNIYLSDKIPSPFILGIIRPKIYLPSYISEEDKEYILCHEKAHIKRGDHLWKPLSFVLLAVYWFNPILWVAYVLLCRDIELACDEKVIKSLGEDIKKPYSLALINYSSPRRIIAACPLAFGEVGVKQRVKRVLNYKKPAFWIIIVSLVAITVAAVCLLTNPPSTICIEDIKEPFSMEGMLDGINKITYNNDEAMTITDKSEIDTIVASLKDMHLKSKPLSADDDRCSHLEGSITLFGNNTSVSIYVPGYGNSDNEQEYEPNVVRLNIANIGDSYDYAVVDTDVLTEIIQLLKSQAEKSDNSEAENAAEPNKASNRNPGIGNIVNKNQSTDNKIDIFKGLDVVGFGMSFWNGARHEFVQAQIHPGQVATLKKALSGISCSRAEEYYGKQPLFTFTIQDTHFKNIKINFYNKEYNRITTEEEYNRIISDENFDREKFYAHYVSLMDIHNIDDVCIFMYETYYGFDNAKAKETLIKLLKEIVEHNNSPLTRCYGMDKLVCANNALSFMPIPGNTPAYYFNSYADPDDYDENSCSTTFRYFIYTLEKDMERTRSDLREPLGTLKEIDLTSKEYDSFFSNPLEEYGYSVSQFRSPENKAYYVASDSNDYIISITPNNEMYMAIGSKKNVNWILRLKDITPCPGGTYMDHIFYDIDGDGNDEACTLSYNGASYVNYLYFTARRNGAVIYNTLILLDTEMKLKFTVDGGKLKVIGEETGSSKQHTFDVIMKDDSLTNIKVIVLSEGHNVLTSYATISTASNFELKSQE